MFEVLGIVNWYIPAGSIIVSRPEPAGQPPKAVSVLAAVMASRSEQADRLVLYSSMVVVTVILPADKGAAWTTDCGAGMNTPTIKTAMIEMRGATANIRVDNGC
jgi:hypothetical protein